MYANDNNGWIIPYGGAVWGTSGWWKESTYFRLYLGNNADSIT